MSRDLGAQYPYGMADHTNFWVLGTLFRLLVHSMPNCTQWQAMLSIKSTDSQCHCWHLKYKAFTIVLKAVLLTTLYFRIVKIVLLTSTWWNWYFIFQNLTDFNIQLTDRQVLDHWHCTILTAPWTERQIYRLSTEIALYWQSIQRNFKCNLLFKMPKNYNKSTTLNGHLSNT